MDNNKKIHLAVVDDDQVLSDNIKSFFENKGFEVSVASDGAFGLKLIQEKNPDIVLLDIMMPFRSGIKILEELSKDNKEILKKIILMTNSTDASNVSAALEMGIKEYLIKSDMSLENVYELCMKKVQK